MSTNKYGYLKRKSRAITSTELEFSINAELQNGSNASQIGRTDTKWASLELDRLNLNTSRGSRFYFASSEDELEVVTVAQSDSQGAFSPSIKLTATVKDGRYITQNGITFVGLNLIKSAKVYAYRDNVRVSSYSFTNEDTINTDLGYEKKQVFLADFNVINKIEFIVYSIDKPNQFFYVRDFRLEAEEEFKDDTIIDIEAVNRISIDGETLEYSTLDFTIKKDEFDRVFQKNEAISLVVGENSSKFFTQQSTELENSYSLNCSDFTSLLESEFLGGMYNNELAGYLINNCLGSELSEFYMVDSSIFTEELNGYLPICTKREALQQILLAVNARKYKRGETEVFSQFDTNLNPFVYDETNIIENPTIIRNEPLKKIIVREHNYSPISEEVEVYNWYAKYGARVLFSEPLWGLKIYYKNTDTGDGETLEEWLNQDSLERHDNYCIITSTSNFKFIIKGKKYTDSVVEFVKENPYVVENQDYLTKTVDLYVHGNSQEVCDFLYEIYSRPYSIKFQTLNRPELGGYYSILGHKLNIKSVKETLNGIYEVEAC